MPPTSSTTRFELPALGNFESLTKGTNIPPPLESPVDEVSLTLPLKSTPTTEEITSTTPTSSSSNYNDENQPPHQQASVSGSPVSGKPGSVRKFLSRKSLNHSYVNGINSFEYDPGARPDSPATYSTNSRRKSGSNWLKRLVNGGKSQDKTNMRRASTLFESNKAEQQQQKAGYQTSPPGTRQISSSKGNGVLNGVSNGVGNGLGNGVRTHTAPVKKLPVGPPPPKLPELHQLKAKVDESTGSLGGGDMFAAIGK